MKKLILRMLSWCFPLRELDAPWRTILSLSIIRPPSKHRFSHPFNLSRAFRFPIDLHKGRYAGQIDFEERLK